MLAFLSSNSGVSSDWVLLGAGKCLDRLKTARFASLINNQPINHFFGGIGYEE